ncbi:MAG TPA: CdaR family protein [Terriglobales bacterium]|nr:CdaR family protein [Terriglobales bacterium]
MLDFLRRYVFANLALKLLSLALAVGLWLAITRDPIAEVEVTVPIEFHHVPGNLEISSMNIPEAQVRVRGPERVIHQLRPADVRVEVDVSGVKPGERTFDLTAQQVHQPRALEVVQVVPSQVRLSFDTGITRQVPVRPRVIGVFAPGVRITQVLATPATVAITGPKQRVEAVEAATTDPVDASGTMSRSTFVTSAYVADPLVQMIRPVPVRVTVVVEGEATSPEPKAESRP